MIARLALVSLLASCATKTELRPEDVRVERIVLTPTFELARLDDSTWIHTTSKQLPDVGPFPSNGLLVRTDAGVVLIDTPWTAEATATLVDWVQTRLGVPITDVIVTHSHDDRTGGVAALPASTQVHALALTSKLAAKENRPLNASEISTGRSALILAGERFETIYPGPGHAPDNLLVWVPRHRVVVGGCFLRSAESKSLGNLADADVGHWRASIANVEPWLRETEPDPKRPTIVLPGHGPLGGIGLLTHTRQLVDAAQR